MVGLLETRVGLMACVVRVFQGFLPEHAGIETEGDRLGDGYLREIGVRRIHDEICVALDDGRGNQKRQRSAALRPGQAEIAAREVVEFAPI